MERICGSYTCLIVILVVENESLTPAQENLDVFATIPQSKSISRQGDQCPTVNTESTRFAKNAKFTRDCRKVRFKKMIIIYWKRIYGMMSQKELREKIIPGKT